MIFIRLKLFVYKASYGTRCILIILLGVNILHLRFIMCYLFSKSNQCFSSTSNVEFKERFYALYTVFYVIILFLIFHLVSMSFQSMVQVVRKS